MCVLHAFPNGETLACRAVCVFRSLAVFLYRFGLLALPSDEYRAYGDPRRGPVLQFALSGIRLESLLDDAKTDLIAESTGDRGESPQPRQGERRSSP
jgi:hypothetical protein